MRKRNEPVRLTRIYTRAGDKGMTSLGEGTRVAKSDQRVEAYGTVQELNAAVGHALVTIERDDLRDWLRRVQNDLFDLGADLAVPLEDTKRERLRMQDDHVAVLERLCDLENQSLEPLKSFVLPGGTEAGSRLHLAATVCRRAERHAVRLAELTSVSEPALAYLNRLGDLLFILARSASAGHETLWEPGRSLTAA